MKRQIKNQKKLPSKHVSDKGWYPKYTKNSKLTTDKRSEYYYTLIKIAKILNTDNIKCWLGCEAKGAFTTQSLLKRVWQFLKKLNINSS